MFISDAGLNIQYGRPARHVQPFLTNTIVFAAEDFQYPHSY
jgi:hypothetical protein